MKVISETRCAHYIWYLFFIAYMYNANETNCFHYICSSFTSCIDCLSAKNGFWLPIWYLQTLLSFSLYIHFSVFQEESNSTMGWILIQNFSHDPLLSKYSFNLTGLDTDVQYRFRVDVRAQDGEKLLTEYSTGFKSEYYKTACIGECIGWLVDWLIVWLIGV